MPGTLKRVAGPIALTNTLTTTLYNQSSALIYDSIKQINIINKTSSPHTFTAYLGASGGNVAGTEIAFQLPIPANSVVPLFFSPGLKMLSSDFIVGGADANTALTIVIISEQFVV